MSALKGACNKDFGLAVLMIRQQEHQRPLETWIIDQVLIEAESEWVKESVAVFNPLFAIL